MPTSLSDLLQQPPHRSLETEREVSAEIPSQDQPRPSQSRPAEISHHQLHSDHPGGGRGLRGGAGEGAGACIPHPPSTHARPHLVSSLCSHLPCHHLTFLARPRSRWTTPSSRWRMTFSPLNSDARSGWSLLALRRQIDNCSSCCQPGPA